MTITQQVHHYSVAHAKRGFLQHALPAYRYPADVWRSRVLLWNFFRRSLLGRFRGSLGGVLWVLVHPIFQFLVYFAVFGILFAPRDELQGGPDAVFAVYLFAGILVFGTITESTTSGLSSILGNGNLVKKVAFPCELLPLTPVLVATIVYVVGCVVLMAVGLATGVVSPGWSLLAWPVLVVCLVVFCTGFAMLLAAANVFVRDIAHIWNILSLAWFFMSPVFWRLSRITDKFDDFGVPWAVDLLVLNPAYNLLLAQRQVFGIGWSLPPAEYLEWFPHSLGHNLMCGAAWSVVMFVVGYGFFMSRKHKFADLV